MTRTHAARQLLRHGPLAMSEFKEITGWPQKQAHNTIKALLSTGAVVATKSPSLRTGINLYVLASAPTANGCTSLNQPTRKRPINDTGSNCRG